MVVVDANVLIYAVNQASAHHRRSRAWLDGALGGAESVGFSWVSMLAFLRIVTHPRLFPNPLGIDEALAQVSLWLEAPAAVVIEPTSRHLSVLAGLLGTASTGANLVNDAHLAAMAVEHAATIISFDRDFARFPGVNHSLPPAPEG